MDNIFLTCFRSPKFHVQDKMFTNFYISKKFYRKWEEEFTPKNSSFLNSDSHLPKNFFFFNESHSEMVKYAFNFILKALFVLEIFKFLP